MKIIWYIYTYTYIYVERTFWVYFVPSPNSIISPPRSNRYIGAILKNKSLWLRNNFSMMNKSAWWEGAGGAANFWSFSSSHSPRKHSASQANCLDSACAHTGLVLKVEAGDRKWVPLEVRVEVKKVSDQQNSKLCEWNWRHSIEQERKSTVQTGLAQVHMGDLSVPSWDACKELRWAEIFKSPLPTLCTLCYPSSFIMFYAAFLFLYCYRDERVVSWPVALYLFIYLLLMGNNGLLRGGWTRFPSAMAFPWSTFSILVVLYLCLSVVAGLEGLPYREHEAKTHWLIDIVFTSLVVFLSFVSLSLSPSDFIWVKGLALEERFGKGSLGYGLAFGLPLHVFVCCCWGGRVVDLRAWSKSSLTLF
jgi:hypothetical protein